MIGPTLTLSHAKMSSLYFILCSCVIMATGIQYDLRSRLGITSCQTQDVDVMFLLDCSGSAYNEYFPVLLDLVLSTALYFNTDDGHLRTAVATFDIDVFVQLYLHDYRDEYSLIHAIHNIPNHHCYEVTNTGLAISIATHELLHPLNGERPGAVKVMILMTGRLSDDHARTLYEARRARDLGINIIAIETEYTGFGGFLDLLNVTGTKENIIRVADFPQMNMVTLAVLSTICPVCDEGDGWVKYEETCYWVQSTDEKITWLEARRRCRAVKAFLTTVYGKDHENFLSHQMSHASRRAYIGLRKDYTNSPGQFRDIFQWEDGTPLIYKNWREGEPNGASLERCVLMNGTGGWEDMFCGERVTNQFICMKDALDKIYRSESTPAVPPISTDVDRNLFANCSDGELVSKFKFCDGQFDCRDKSDETNCGGDCDNTMFKCQNKRCISFTFYCDGTNDCGDMSDEETCTMKPCSDEEWTCRNGQCIDYVKRCNLHPDCIDTSDEDDCYMCRNFECYDGKCIPQTWVGDGAVDCDGFKGEDETGVDVMNMTIDSSTGPDCLYTPDMYGKVRVNNQLGDTSCSTFECPPKFYKCPGSYCIPVFSVCNGVKDCLNGEDEDFCSYFYCPGYYRCEGKQNCIHPSHLCDGVRHCPKGDDERHCQHSCPPFCTCHGRVITCSGNFSFSHSIPLDVRKLDVSGLDLWSKLLDLSDLHYLTVLIMSDCGLVSVSDYLLNFPNLKELDLSNNKIEYLPNSTFLSLPRLKYLDLSNNVLLTTIENGTFTQLGGLKQLNLQNTGLGPLTEPLFLGLSNLEILNLSMTCITEISDDSFFGLESLKDLDIRHNEIQIFGPGIFSGLNSLDELYIDSYQLCCDSIRPKSLSLDDCISTGSMISSCEDLLGQDILRIMLWCIAVIAVAGNVMVLGYRFHYDRKSVKRSYGIFVTNLSVSDCLMGVYMFIVGSADIGYRGSYIWSDYGWRHSSWCKFAGFLAIVSSEASCIFITLITLDRLLAIKFPFGQIKFTSTSTVVSVITTWLLALILAGIPLLPSLQYWELYSQNSVCLALPLSSGRKPGWQYSSALFVGFNFILFLLIGMGQIQIYRTVKSSSRIRTGRSSDAKVARRLFLVVFTDFLCWFPVGIMGVLVLHGFPIDREVYAWTAVTVLPINSALNPILYTVPSIIQARRELLKKRHSNVNKIPSNQGSSLECVSIHTKNTYVGNPTNDMETLRDMLQSHDVPSNIKVDVIRLILAFVLDLQNDNRHFQPVRDDRIFVKRYCEKISAICLSLESDKDRVSVTEDVFYLIELLKEFDRRTEDKKELESLSKDKQELVIDVEELDSATP